MPTSYKPEGHATVTPYLVVEDAARQIEDVFPEEVARRAAERRQA